MPDRDAGVDPRFDPLFQKGYDPAKHRTKVKPEAQGSAAPAPAAVPTRRSDTEVDAASDPIDVSGMDTPDTEPPRRNPFRLALLLFSLAAIAGAALVLWKRIASDPYQGYGGYGGDVGKIFLDQFADAALTPLLTGGLLGLCLWFALGALRRRDHG